jgi:Ni,Fe-hydrogenase III component G
MIENIIEIDESQLIAAANKMSYEDYRFVTISCIELKNGNFDLIYHFDKNFVLQNYRLNFPKETEISSISKIYFCALLVENEIKELFGVNVTNIILDYGGHLLLSEGAPDRPMLCNQIEIVRKGE